MPPPAEKKIAKENRASKTFKEAFTKSNIQAKLSAIKTKTVVLANTVASEVGIKSHRD